MSAEANLPDVIVTPKPRERTETRRFPPYHVILLNDDHHSCEFVVDVLRKTFGYNEQRSFQLMWQAHTTGRAIIWTGPREVAELKVEQLTSFHEIHADGRKLGPLDCELEPAPAD